MADTPQAEESVEQKKERMREFIAADRKLEKEKSKRERRRGRGGCLFGMLRLIVFAAVLAGVGYLIWLWHPWSTEIVETNAVDQVGICGPGVQGTQTVEYFTVLGIRLYESGQSTICLE